MFDAAMAYNMVMGSPMVKYLFIVVFVFMSEQASSSGEKPLPIPKSLPKSKPVPTGKAIPVVRSLPPVKAVPKSKKVRKPKSLPKPRTLKAGEAFVPRYTEKSLKEFDPRYDSLSSHSTE